MRRLAAAFTLIELLIVMAVLALLAAAGLPALCRTKTPVSLLQCLSNVRQMGQASLLYRADHSDAYPYGTRVTSGSLATNVNGWPMQLLRYMGGYKNAQPKVYLCPAETGFAESWAIQLHYHANRMLVSDVDSTETPTRGAQVRNPAIYWLFMEKGPWDFASVKPGSIANPILATWNQPPGYPSYRRHSGGLSTAAADGHCDWLRMPAYEPGRLPPMYPGELGDCANGQSPPSTWQDPNPNMVKLYSRYNQAGF